MKKKWLALALAGLMGLMPCLGVAEGQAAFDAAQVQPLLDAVAAAALSAPEEARELSADESMAPAFLSGLLGALKTNGLPADPESVSGMFAMEMPAFMDAADVTPAAMTVVAADPSEDGDAVMLVGEIAQTDLRAAVELHQDDASPLGWKLYRFSFSDVALIEALTDNYFIGTMIEYLNTDCGYSIQYPSIFTEDLLVETTTGIQAELQDGSASFSVMRMDNIEGLTMDALLAREKEVIPDAAVLVDEITGSGVSVATDEEGFTHVAVFLVSDVYIYQAELNYAQDQAERYATFVEYMINSFSADELGLG